MKLAKRIVMLVLGGLGILYLAIAAIMHTTVQQSSFYDEDLPTLIIVFGALGVLLLFLAAVLPWLMGMGERRRKALLGWGQRVSATVMEVRPNYSVRVNRRSPWIVYAECMHPITGQKALLHSHNVWDCHLAPGQKVDIVFDQMNEKRFAFDIPEAEGSSL